MTRISISVLSAILIQLFTKSCQGLTNDIINSDANSTIQPVRTTTVETPASKSPSFVVSLQKYTEGHYEHICGGAIIDEQFMITTAHCVLKPVVLFKSRLSVVGGSTQIFGKDSIRFRVIGMTTHPRFKFLKGYDILVIRVSPKFPIDGKRFSIINFKDAKRRSTGLDAVLLGWGRLGNRPYKPKNLESIPFKTIDNQVCLQTYRFKYLTETEICAVHSNPKIGLRGACDGDSGAPLVDLNNNIIYGLLSYGRRACQPQKPYAFTRISAHVNWIQQQMANLMRNSGK